MNYRNYNNKYGYVVTTYILNTHTFFQNETTKVSSIYMYDNIVNADVT